jgi:hypothetical protein
MRVVVSVRVYFPVSWRSVWVLVLAWMSGCWVRVNIGRILSSLNHHQFLVLVLEDWVWLSTLSRADHCRVWSETRTKTCVSLRFSWGRSINLKNSWHHCVMTILFFFCCFVSSKPMELGLKVVSSLSDFPHASFERSLLANVLLLSIVSALRSKVRLSPPSRVDSWIQVFAFHHLLFTLLDYRFTVTLSELHSRGDGRFLQLIRCYTSSLGSCFSSLSQTSTLL